MITEDEHACLADFGLTRIDGEISTSGPDKPGGTALWMSPEISNPETFGGKKVGATTESDIYAFGMLIYEVCMIFAAWSSYLI